MVFLALFPRNWRIIGLVVLSLEIKNSAFVFHGSIEIDESFIINY